MSATHSTVAESRVHTMVRGLARVTAAHSSRALPSAKALSYMRRRPETLIHPAGQIIRAHSHAERARVVLQLPDAIAIEHSIALHDACLAAGFRDGACFINIRVLAALAVRTPTGELPAELAQSVETWRRGMVALAGRSTP